MNNSILDILQALLLSPAASQRTLARETGYSLGLVNRALQELSRDGYLEEGRPSSRALQLAQRAAPRRAVILAAGPGMHMVPINTETPKELSGTPSLVLRCLGKQECAWDLAKRYNTTIAAILSANQLESEEELGRDQLLLIPRKRA